MKGEGVNNFVSAIIVSAIEGLSVPDPVKPAVWEGKTKAERQKSKSNYAAKLTAVRKNRRTAIAFFNSVWGQWLLASQGIEGIPKELAEKITAARKEQRKVLD